MGRCIADHHHRWLHNSTNVLRTDFNQRRNLADGTRGQDVSDRTAVGAVGLGHDGHRCDQRGQGGVRGHHVCGDHVGVVGVGGQ